MTKKQVFKHLKTSTDWLAANPGPWWAGDPNFHTAWKHVWNKAFYEECLKANVDPDSILHPSETKEGKGVPIK